MTQLTISICTYNRLNFIKSCMLSLAKCTSIELVEIHIIDNSSNDETQHFFEINQPTLKNFTYHRIPSNGLSFARNHAISICKTPYLAFFDDDCIFDKNCISEIVHFLELNKPMVFTGTVVGILPYNKADCVNPNEIANTISPNGEPSYLPGNFMGMAISIFDKVPLFNTNFGKNKAHLGYGEDTLFEMDVKSAGLQILTIPNAKVYHLSLGFGAKEWYVVNKQQAIYLLKYQTLNGNSVAVFSKACYRSTVNLLKLFLKTIASFRWNNIKRYELLKELAKMHGNLHFLFNQ